MVALLGGGAAIGYSVTRKATTGMTPAQTTAMTHAVDQLDGEIRTARAQVLERARSMSGPVAVHAAIATNADTLDNLVRSGDLVPVPGEILELGRVFKIDVAAGGPLPASPRGTVEPLLVAPQGATRMSHKGMVGSYADLMADQLAITEVVKVDPTDNADVNDQVAGYLSVTRPLSLAPAVKALADAGITGKLVIGDKELAIGTMPAGARVHEEALRSQPDAKLVAAEPPPRAVLPLSILVGGIGAAVIGLLLLIIGMMGKRDDAGASMIAGRSAFNAMPTMPTTPPGSIGNDQTQLSHARVAAGTPSTLDPTRSQQIVPQNLGPGSMIGRWEVVRRLGSGGMADVYLAQAKGDGGFEKLVAVKVMHSHLARTQRAVDHFLDEARLAARIQHPNVVQIQDLGKIGNDYVIVMEYVEGVDLERLLISARQAQRPVPLGIGLGILCRICDGLDAAHNATSPDGTPMGLVHRDVKAANVLVSRQGSVKVVDFGIAKAATQVHYTVAGETKGTPSMMAPEQRVGEQVDVRADVYSLAAVGYELVTGHGVNLDLAALAHLGVENWPHLPLPSSLRPDAPAELDEILLHAMAFDRERRPASAADLEASLEAVMKAHGLGATDKDIARWVDGELRLLSPAFGGQLPSIVKSV
ncbi:MAG TPA: serine/threonine-protein kinase [Kofleriaceae bacterium]